MSPKKINPLWVWTRKWLSSTAVASFVLTWKIGFLSGKFITCSVISATLNQLLEKSRDFMWFSGPVILPLLPWITLQEWVFLEIISTSDTLKIRKTTSKDQWNTASPFTSINPSTGHFLFILDSLPKGQSPSIHHLRPFTCHRSRRRIVMMLRWGKYLGSMGTSREWRYWCNQMRRTWPS